MSYLHLLIYTCSVPCNAFIFFLCIIIIAVGIFLKHTIFELLPDDCFSSLGTAFIFSVEEISLTFWISSIIRSSFSVAPTTPTHDLAQRLPYSSWWRHQLPPNSSLRPLGARSSHWYMPQRPSSPRA